VKFHALKGEASCLGRLPVWRVPSCLEVGRDPALPITGEKGIHAAHLAAMEFAILTWSMGQGGKTHAVRKGSEEATRRH